MHLLFIKFKRVFLIISIAGVIGCSNSYVDEIDRGDSYDYKPGFPELRLTANGLINEQNHPVIEVTGDIVYGSLVYGKSDSLFESNFQIEIVIQDTDNDSLVDRKNFKDTLQSNSNSIINSQQVYSFKNSFNVYPGQFSVLTAITDLSSGKQSFRKVDTSIPNPDGQNSHLTEIRVLGKNSEEQGASFKQATTYDIPFSQDSLKFLFQVTNNNSEEPLTIEARLLKFMSDTSIARPMNFNNYSPSSITQIGIDYTRYNEIQKTQRTLNQNGTVNIEFNFENLPQGNYRLESYANKGTENEIYKAREFSIKPPFYPSLKKPSQLAEPLYYIMDMKEYEKLMSIKNADSIKVALDQFWLSNIGNSKKARQVISLYYQRVEEANKLFSNYKEGWKTDPGMMYILFGPPWYSETYTDQMIWYYSYNRDDPEKTFLFNQSKLRSKFYPFFNFILQRDAFYNSIQVRQIDRWRTGTILNTNL